MDNAVGKFYTVAVTTRKYIENFFNENIQSILNIIMKLKGFAFFGGWKRWQIVFKIKCDSIYVL